MARLTVNGKALEVNVDPSTPLLWVIREQVGLTGTKYGCGVAQCGACTVHLDGAAIRSCVMPVAGGRGQADHHHRRPRRRRRPAQGAAGLARAPGAAVRLLPVGHDHGGGRAPEGQAEADRRRHRRGRSPTSAAAARSSRCVRPSTPRRRHRGSGHDRQDSEDRSPLLPRRHRRRRRRARPRPEPPVRRQRRPRPGRLARDHRLGGHPPGRHRRDPGRALRDGTGHAHRPRPDGGRGARVRLVEGDDRISRRPARASRASACGATSPRAAAAASASRTSTCARAAPRRG